MSIDIEEMLARELHDVASDLQVPPMPPLPAEAPSTTHRVRDALLVAAVIVLVLGAALMIDALGGGSHEPEPAPGPAPRQIPATPPLAPYVLDQRLYVGGQQVPGDWVSVQAGTAGWVAWRADGTWWWGTDATARPVTRVAGVPVISPNGRYVAAVDDVNGVLSAFDTRTGRGFGTYQVDLGDPARTGDPVHVGAVTDDGLVFVQGAAASLLWRPLDGSQVTDIDPDQRVVGSTAAGLLVIDGLDGPVYLAELSSSGGLTRIESLAGLDPPVTSPDGQWLASTRSGTLGGEVAAVIELQVQRLGGSGRSTLRPPGDWLFRVSSWAWEDDDYLVSPVIRDDGSPGERLVRCSPIAGRCVLIDAAT
jgi:hypothetical protein